MRAATHTPTRALRAAERIGARILCPRGPRPPPQGRKIRHATISLCTSYSGPLVGRTHRHRMRVPPSPNTPRAEQPECGLEAEWAVSSTARHLSSLTKARRGVRKQGCDDENRGEGRRERARGRERASGGRGRECEGERYGSPVLSAAAGMIGVLDIDK